MMKVTYQESLLDGSNLSLTLVKSSGVNDHLWKMLRTLQEIDLPPLIDPYEATRTRLIQVIRTYCYRCTGHTTTTATVVVDAADQIDLEWKEWQVRFTPSLNKWIKQPELKQLFIYESTSTVSLKSSLVVQIAFTHPLQHQLAANSRLILLMKGPTVKDMLTIDNVSSVLAFDLSTATRPTTDEFTPLQGLCQLIEAVYTPFVIHPGNQAGLPHVISSEVMDQFHDLRATLLANNSWMKPNHLTQPHLLTTTSNPNNHPKPFLPMPPDSIIKLAELELNKLITGDGIISPTSSQIDEWTLAHTTAMKLIERLITVTWSAQVKRILPHQGNERELEDEHYQELRIITEDFGSTSSNPPSLSSKRQWVTHPTPLAEIEYWQMKLSQLTHLHSQLIGVDTQRLDRLLELRQSAAHATLRQLLQLVVKSKSEAENHVRHLTPLRPLLEQISHASESSDAFVSLGTILLRFFKIVELIWYNPDVAPESQPLFASHPSKLVLIYRLLCNLLIEQSLRLIHAVSKPISSSIAATPSTPTAASTTFHNNFFQSSAQSMESSERINLVDQLLTHVLQLFHEHRLKLTGVKRPNSATQFQLSNLLLTKIFARLNKFHLQCQTILTIIQTIRFFQAISIIELGGRKGRTLSEVLGGMVKEVDHTMQLFGSVDYPLIHPDFFHQFEARLPTLQAHLTQFYERFSTLITHSFQYDCITFQEKLQHVDIMMRFLQMNQPNDSTNSNVHSLTSAACYPLIHTFQSQLSSGPSLLHRTILTSYLNLLQQFREDELHQIQIIFMTQKKEMDLLKEHHITNDSMENMNPSNDSIASSPIGHRTSSHPHSTNRVDQLFSSLLHRLTHSYQQIQQLHQLFFPHPLPTNELSHHSTPTRTTDSIGSSTPTTALPIAGGLLPIRTAEEDEYDLVTHEYLLLVSIIQEYAQHPPRP